MSYLTDIDAKAHELPNIPEGVLPEKLGGGVRPTSQNPYPIYDQNLRFCSPIYDLAKNSKPYL